MRLSKKQYSSRGVICLARIQCHQSVYCVRLGNLDCLNRVVFNKQLQIMSEEVRRRLAAEEEGDSTTALSDAGEWAITGFK